jgi:hypothetical protein
MMMMTSDSRNNQASWWSHYGAATFWSKDFGAGLIALVGASCLFFLSMGARSAGTTVLTSTLGVCAGLLGIVLAAMAVVTAFITRTFVAMVNDIGEVLQPFVTVAFVAAGGVLISLFGLPVLGAHVFPWWASAAVLALSVGVTVWAIVGVAQLVVLIRLFATYRAQELMAQLDAEYLRDERLQEAPRMRDDGSDEQSSDTEPDAAPEG